MAVSIFSTRRTTSSISRARGADSSAMRAPVPAALPAEVTRSQVAVGDEAEHERVAPGRCGCRTRRRAGCGRRARSRSARAAACSRRGARPSRAGSARTSFCVIVSARLAVGEHVGERAPVGDDPVGERRRRVRRRSCRRSSMIPARYSSAIASMMPEPQTPVSRRRGLGEAGLVRPELAADHPVARLERVRVDAHPLDRAGRGALAAADLGALEGRAGGARRGEQAVAVAEHDLGVGADVDDQVALVVRAVRALGEDHRRRCRRRRGRRCRAARRRARPGARRARARPRGSVHRLVDRERERRLAELGRVEAERRGGA